MSLIRRKAVQGTKAEYFRHICLFNRRFYYGLATISKTTFSVKINRTQHSVWFMFSVTKNPFKLSVVSPIVAAPSISPAFSPKTPRQCKRRLRLSTLSRQLTFEAILAAKLVSELPVAASFSSSNPTAIVWPARFKENRLTKLKNNFRRLVAPIPGTQITLFARFWPGTCAIKLLTSVKNMVAWACQCLYISIY